MAHPSFLKYALSLCLLTSTSTHVTAKPYASGQFTIPSQESQCVHEYVPLGTGIAAYYFTVGNETDHKEEFVACLDHGKVWRNGMVMDRNNRILANFVMQWPGKTLQDHCLMKGRGCVEEEVNVPGTLASIENAGFNNYYHWMFQVLPRIHVLQAAGIPFDKIFFSEPLIHSFQKETLAALGITDSLIFQGDGTGTIYQADTLLVPSISTIPAFYKSLAFEGWIKDFLTRTFVHHPHTRPEKKIYISRRDTTTRRVANEEELITRLKNHGFDVVTLGSLSVHEQAQVFYDAHTIVAQHGAGLTNLIFARAGTRVVEINSEDPYNYLCAATGLKHTSFQKVQLKNSPEDKERLIQQGIPENKLDSTYDVIVDINGLEALL